MAPPRGLRQALFTERLRQDTMTRHGSDTNLYSFEGLIAAAITYARRSLPNAKSGNRPKPSG